MHTPPIDKGRIRTVDAGGLSTGQGKGTTATENQSLERNEDDETECNENCPQSSINVRTNCPEKSDSDSEWETIAKVNKKILSGNTKQQILPSRKRDTRAPTERRVKFGQNTTKVLHTMDESQEYTMKLRGFSMAEEKNHIKTPVSIEFNLPDQGFEFHIIQECKNLFQIMSINDSPFRVFDVDEQQLLWEPSVPLPDESQFEQLFRMKDRSFRNGKRKVTLYCVIIGISTINRIKFRDPVQSYLRDNNIWIKPDFYCTQTVSSPGFLTMLHPTFTHKISLTKELTDILSDTDIDASDEVVLQWKQQKQSTTCTGGTPVPKFHIETTLKKWGSVQVEVLSLQCSKEDSQYLKYICVEASSQQKFTPGIFVPAGLHLLEGKEVVTNILTEHQSFLEKTTGFQLNGLDPVMMEHKGEDGQTGKQRLDAGPGVCRVEQTYLTASKGQWVIVATVRDIQGLLRYITDSLHLFYRHSTSVQPKLVTISTESNQPTYKLALINKSLSRVGTYAEVLRRRFVPGPNDSTVLPVTEVNTQSDNTQSDTPAAGTVQSSKPSDDERKPLRNPINFPPLPSKPTPSETNARFNDTQDNDSTLVHDDNIGIDLTDAFSHTENSEMDIESIQTQLKDLKKETEKMIEAVEDSIEKTIDAILDKKLKTVSIVVANAVTKRIMQAMDRKLSQAKLVDQPYSDSPTMQVTQQSPVITKETVNVFSDDSAIESIQKVAASHITTKQMLDALPAVGTRNSFTNDPIHDNITGLRTAGE